MSQPADDTTPGALTGPEAMLLGLVREGRMDAEIAVRLGLSTGEVKDRIERLATKLNVTGRAGLREPAPAATPSDATPLPAPERGPRAIAARGLLALTAILAIAALAFLAGRRSANDATPAAATALAPTIAPTAAATFPAPTAAPPLASPTAALTVTAVVVRDGQQFYDLGKMVSMPFTLFPVASIEERGAATVVTMSGDSFVEFGTGTLPWALNHSLPPGSDGFFLNATVKNQLIRVRVQTSSDLTHMVSGPSGAAFYSSQPGGQTALIVSATDIQTGNVHWSVTFDSAGHLLIAPQQVPVNAAINEPTGEVLDLSHTQILPPLSAAQGAPNTQSNDCVLPGSPCRLRVGGDVLAPIAGTLTCNDGTTRLAAATFTLVMQRSTSTGIQPCQASGPRIMAAGDVALPAGAGSGGATLSAEAPDGTPLSIVTDLVGTTYVGPISVKYGCPCMRGS